MRKELFTKKYFQTINYTNYLERSKKYVKHAEDIIQLLESISLTTKKSRILDYGCAVGFLIEGLNEKGYKIARRTVSKYREQLKLPVTRLRRCL